jgi:4-hydroxy-tetrahydrodipicolinate synthase
MKLSGVFTALVTPFHNHIVDYEAFRQLCQRQLQSGVAGLVPCGTTGETPALSQEEWIRLISVAVEVAAGNKPVIAGCGSNSTSQTIENIRLAKQLGVDAALVVFPYYNKPNPAGLLAHVKAVCAEELPIVLYHVPGRTGQHLGAEQLEELCRIPGVVGLKEATGDVALGQELVNRLSDTNVSLLSGDDFTFAALVAMGFDGVISVISNPAPQQTVSWYQAGNVGDITSLRSLRAELLPVVATLFSSTNPLPCKAIMATMGLLYNEARLPLQAIELEGSWEHLQ